MQKLRNELESSTSLMFPSPGQHQRIKSVLSDLSKTASDLRHITSKALDHVANGLMPQLRCDPNSFAHALLMSLANGVVADKT